MSEEDHDGQGGELECRVCRMGEEEDRPLYTPCQCSGSIGSVHQDCLEAWLIHSKKDSCELCATKYQFEAQYSPDAPDKIPITALLKSVIRLSTFTTIPFILKSICAIIVWIVCIPVLTVWAYSFCMGRSDTFMHTYTMETIFSYIRYGIVIDITIVVTMLVLLSFTDFLRMHWGRQPGQPAPQRPRRGGRNGAAFQQQRMENLQNIQQEQQRRQQQQPQNFANNLLNNQQQNNLRRVNANRRNNINAQR